MKKLGKNMEMTQWQIRNFICGCRGGCSSLCSRVPSKKSMALNGRARYNAG